MKTDVCCWCPQVIEVPDTRDMGITPCSSGCEDAEIMFRVHFSDKELNRRAHYYALTQGDDYGQK